MNANPGSPAWDSFLADHPRAHVLQSRAWGELKSAFGWQSLTVRSGPAGALVLLRRLAPGMTLAYVPRGPVGGPVEKLLPELDRVCAEQGAFMLKVEPDQPWDAARAVALRAAGLRQSPQTIQPASTIVIDLEPDEDEILARMKQKTRYNIRLAGRKGVMVRAWDDLPSFARMMDETAARDEFGAHSLTYYQKAYELFHARSSCELLVAEFEGQALAALMVFARGERAWYFYGASRDAHREKMPTYLLQWEAMRWAKARGCRLYDLWGIPDKDEAVLERDFQDRSDGLWGVYRFKRGFGGQVVRSLGAWDRVYRPLRYALYRLGLRAVRRGAA